MTGFHWDSPDNFYGGYATKANTYIEHGTVPSHIQYLINSNWTLKWGNKTGTVTCRDGEDVSRVNGTFNYGAGTLPISISYANTERTILNIRVGDRVINARFLNHEQGIICGDGGYAEMVLLYKN